MKDYFFASFFDSGTGKVYWIGDMGGSNMVRSNMVKEKKQKKGKTGKGESVSGLSFILDFYFR